MASQAGAGQSATRLNRASETARVIRHAPFQVPELDRLEQVPRRLALCRARNRRRGKWIDQHASAQDLQSTKTKDDNRHHADCQDSVLCQVHLRVLLLSGWFRSGAPAPNVSCDERRASQVPAGNHAEKQGKIGGAWTPRAGIVPEAARKNARRRGSDDGRALTAYPIFGCFNLAAISKPPACRRSRCE